MRVDLSVKIQASKKRTTSTKTFFKPISNDSINKISRVLHLSRALNGRRVCCISGVSGKDRAKPGLVFTGSKKKKNLQPIAISVRTKRACLFQIKIGLFAYTRAGYRVLYALGGRLVENGFFEIVKTIRGRIILSGGHAVPGRVASYLVTFGNFDCVVIHRRRRRRCPCCLF